MKAMVLSQAAHGCSRWSVGDVQGELSTGFCRGGSCLFFFNHRLSSALVNKFLVFATLVVFEIFSCSNRRCRLFQFICGLHIFLLCPCYGIPNQHKLVLLQLCLFYFFWFLISLCSNRSWRHWFKNFRFWLYLGFKLQVLLVCSPNDLLNMMRVAQKGFSAT